MTPLMMAVPEALCIIGNKSIELKIANIRKLTVNNTKTNDSDLIRLVGVWFIKLPSQAYRLNIVCGHQIIDKSIIRRVSKVTPTEVMPSTYNYSN